MNLYTAINETENIADELIKGMQKVNASDIGLDIRAGYTLYCDEYSVGVRTANIGSLNYYGGFEYVNKENIKVIGRYTFFLGDEERVQDCLDHLDN